MHPFLFYFIDSLRVSFFPVFFRLFCLIFVLCFHRSFVDVPLIFSCPADNVPDWQPRILLGMVEARSVNVMNTRMSTCGEVGSDVHALTKELAIRRVQHRSETHSNESQHLAEGTEVARLRRW